MPFTENFVQMVWGGSAFEGAETWSNGTKLKGLGGDDPVAMQQKCVDNIVAVSVKINTYFTALNSLYSGALKLEWVRLNVINKTTGKYFYPNSPLLYEYPAPVTNGALVGVPQVAYCVSLHSSLKRGPASRGRWYVPITQLQLPASGKMASTICGNAASSAQTFLEGIANLAAPTEPDPFAPWLYGKSQAGVGADSAVQQVLVGNVLDTQRRRRAQLDESFFGQGGYDPT